MSRWVNSHLLGIAYLLCNGLMVKCLFSVPCMNALNLMVNFMESIIDGVTQCARWWCSIQRGGRCGHEFILIGVGSVSHAFFLGEGGGFLGFVCIYN